MHCYLRRFILGVDSFWITEICFMAQNTVYLGKCSVWPYEQMGILPFLFKVVCKCSQVKLVDSITQVSYNLWNFFSVSLLHHLLRWITEISDRNCECFREFLLVFASFVLKFYYEVPVARWQRICLPVQETWVQTLGQEDSLEKEMATPSSTLSWEILWTEGPGRLQSRGLQKSETQLSD